MPDPRKYPLFQLFEPTEGKIMYFAKKLMTEYLYITDPWRNYWTIHQILNRYVTNPRENVLYEIGDFDGILGFVDIVPGWKAHMTFKLWNKEKWGPDLVGQSRDFIREVMDELHLVRLDSATADPRIVRMSKMVGFQVEGTQKHEFMWDGKLYDQILLAITRESGEGNK